MEPDAINPATPEAVEVVCKLLYKSETVWACWTDEVPPEDTPPEETPPEAPTETPKLGDSEELLFPGDTDAG